MNRLDGKVRHFRRCTRHRSRNRSTDGRSRGAVVVGDILVELGETVEA
jgi:hypothetical protein